MSSISGFEESGDEKRPGRTSKALTLIGFQFWHPLSGSQNWNPQSGARGHGGQYLPLHCLEDCFYPYQGIAAIGSCNLRLCWPRAQSLRQPLAWEKAYSYVEVKFGNIHQMQHNQFASRLYFRAQQLACELERRY